MNTQTVNRTLTGLEGLIGGGETGNELVYFNPYERRVFARAKFVSPAVFYPDGGGEIHGTTKEVGFNGTILLISDSDSLPQVGQGGRIHIGLSDHQSVDSCFAPFLCQVVRVDANGIAFRFSPTGLPDQMTNLPCSTVTIRRSNGALDPEWRVVFPHEPIPPLIRARVQEQMSRQDDRGPVVVCYKRSPSGENMFKIMSITALKEIQDLAGADPEERF